MLRINLLPAYLAERRKRNAAIAGMILLFLVVAGAMLGYNLGVQNPALAKRTNETTQKEAEAKAEQDYETETTNIRSQVQPLKDKVDFVNQVKFYNTLRQKIYRNAAAYTYREVEYNSMAVSANTLAITAYAKNISDIGRFYILMFGNPDVVALSISGVPGWDTIQKTELTPTQLGGLAPTQPYYPITMTATLVNTISPPALPASLADAGATGDTSGGAVPGDTGAPADAGGAPPTDAASPAPGGAPTE